LNNNEPHTTKPKTIRVLYSSRLPRDHEKASAGTKLDQILFLPRIRQIIKSQECSHRLQISLDLFLTNLASSSDLGPAGSLSDINIHAERISDTDLRAAALGKDSELDPRSTVCYVCGPPAMTDAVVEKLVQILGKGGEQRVLFEKWW
jgi:hypothetical protein